MNFSTRSYEKELLDGTGIAPDAIRQNMQELDFINTHLGGHGITIHGFKQLLGSKKEIIICEIGCGGGDNLIAIEKYGKKNNIKIQLVGIDINPDCIAVAKSKSENSNAEWITADYLSVSFGENKPDIIFSSLFCHHFTNPELTAMLQWMQQHSGTGFFINDLHRHPLAYYSIKWLTACFSKSYLVKNDAPLSVRRGFIKNDWITLLELAAIQYYSVKWKWAFRWLIVVRNQLKTI